MQIMLDYLSFNKKNNGKKNYNLKVGNEVWEISIILILNAVNSGATLEELINRSS